MSRLKVQLPFEIYVLLTSPILLVFSFFLFSSFPSSSTGNSSSSYSSRYSSSISSYPSSSSFATPFLPPPFADSNTNPQKSVAPKVLEHCWACGSCPRATLAANRSVSSADHCPLLIGLNKDFHKNPNKNLI